MQKPQAYTLNIAGGSSFSLPQKILDELKIIDSFVSTRVSLRSKTLKPSMLYDTFTGQPKSTLVTAALTQEEKDLFSEYFGNMLSSQMNKAPAKEADANPTWKELINVIKGDAFDALGSADE